MRGRAEFGKGSHGRRVVCFSKTQKDTTASLGTTVTTLRSLVEGEDYPGKRGMGDGAKKPASPLAGLDDGNPVVQLAVKQQRLQAIDSEMAALEREKTTLQAEMKSLYDSVDQQIFGEKQE